MVVTFVEDRGLEERAFVVFIRLFSQGVFMDSVCDVVWNVTENNAVFDTSPLDTGFRESVNRIYNTIRTCKVTIHGDHVAFIR